VIRESDYRIRASNLSVLALSFFIIAMGYIGRWIFSVEGSLGRVVAGIELVAVIGVLVSLLRWAVTVEKNDNPPVGPLCTN
jgi:hypothetical protein